MPPCIAGDAENCRRWQSSSAESYRAALCKELKRDRENHRPRNRRVREFTTLASAIWMYYFHLYRHQNYADYSSWLRSVIIPHHRPRSIAIAARPEAQSPQAARSVAFLAVVGRPQAVSWLRTLNFRSRDRSERHWKRQ